MGDFNHSNKIMTGTINTSDAKTKRVEYVSGATNSSDQNVTLDLSGRPTQHTEEANGGQASETTPEKFPLSKRRWVILFGLCVFGLCNGLVSGES